MYIMYMVTALTKYMYHIKTNIYISKYDIYMTYIYISKYVWPNLHLVAWSIQQFQFQQNLRVFFFQPHRTGGARGILMVLTRTWEILPNFSNGNVIQLRENNIRNEYAMKKLYTAFFVVTISCFCKGTHQKHGLFDKKEIESSWTWGKCLKNKKTLEIKITSNHHP